MTRETVKEAKKVDFAAGTTFVYGGYSSSVRPFVMKLRSQTPVARTRSPKPGSSAPPRSGGKRDWLSLAARMRR